MEPLHALFRKGEKSRWEEAQEIAFRQAKKLLSSTELLVHYNPELPLILHCDASAYGLGAVLSHQMGTEERPIAFTSRTMNPAERNYSMVEKEGLAVIYAVQKFHQYLWGQKFTVVTDHKPLLGLFGESKPVPSLAASRKIRWSLTRSAYNYELLYRPGDANANADALSRLPLQDTAVPEYAPNDVHMVDLERAPVNAEEVNRHSMKDPELVKVMSYVQEGWPEDASCSDSYKKKRHELSVERGTLLWGMRVVVPPTLRRQVLEELHKGHIGIVRMKALSRSYVYWPCMDTDIEGHVSSCEPCMYNSNMPESELPHPWESAGGPWERIHIDHAGPFMNKMLLIVVDTYSRWLEAKVVSSTSALATITALREMLARHGLPRTLVSDNGTGFSSQEFKQFMCKNGISHVRTAPYSPKSNDAAERAVQTVKKSVEVVLEWNGHR